MVFNALWRDMHFILVFSLPLTYFWSCAVYVYVVALGQCGGCCELVFATIYVRVLLANLNYTGAENDAVDLVKAQR